MGGLGGEDLHGAGKGGCLVGRTAEHLVNRGGCGFGQGEAGLVGLGQVGVASDCVQHLGGNGDVSFLGLFEGRSVTLTEAGHIS